MTDLHPGGQLEHFRLDAGVAVSGMATIFRATGLRVGRTVALEMPHPHMESDPAFSERFQRDAEICRELPH